MNGAFSSPQKHFLSTDFFVEDDYDSQNVYLSVALNRAAFCQQGMTSNQCSVGHNLDQILTNGSIQGPLYDWVVNLNSDVKLADVYNQLSGEIHVSGRNALLEDSRFLREAVQNRLLESRADDKAVWTHVFGSDATVKGDGNTANTDRKIGGLFVGVDGQLNEHWTAGMVAGYSNAKIESDPRHSEQDRKDYHLGAYTKGTYGAASFQAGLGHALHDISSERRINLPKLQETLRADYDAATTQLFVEGSYRVKIGEKTAIEPLVNLAYVHTSTDAFTEKGGMAALQGQTDRANLFVSTLGTRFSHEFNLSAEHQGKFWGTVGWRHGFGDTDKKGYLKFDQATPKFGINGTPVVKDAAVLELGVQLPISSNVDVGIMYNGLAGKGVNDHGAKAYLNWRF